MAEISPVFTQDEREKKYKLYKKKIRRSLSTLSKDKADLAAGLIDEAAQYATALEEMRAQYLRDGYEEFYKNGENQFGKKKSVAAELKPKYTASYQSIIKQLAEFLPDEDAKSAADELMEFINGGS